MLIRRVDGHSVSKISRRATFMATAAVGVVVVTLPLRAQHSHAAPVSTHSAYESFLAA
jgi:hypothetical protein